MDAHDNDAEHDGCLYQYDESGDYDGAWIDVSGISNDRTFDVPELAYMLENCLKVQKRVWQEPEKRSEWFGQG